MFLMYKNQGDRSLKQDILELLDDQDGYLSMQEIVNRLEYPTLNAVKTTCKMLQEEITQLYDPTQMELIISVRGGVKLRRYGVYFQALSENEFGNSVTFNMIVFLLLERIVVTSELADKLYVSQSTLLRKLKRHKLLTDNWDIKITCSDTISLSGDEGLIRFLHFLLLIMSYKSINQFPEATSSRHKAQKIMDYLQVNVHENQLLQCVALVFAIDNGLEKKRKLSPTDQTSAYFKYYEYPAKPDFLSWSNEDWQFFLLVLYLTDFDFGRTLIQRKDDCQLFAAERKVFLTTFEKRFRLLSSKEADLLLDHLSRQLQYHAIMPMNKLVFSSFKNQGKKKIAEIYPAFIQRFEDFYLELEQNCETFKKAPYLKANTLLNCIQLIPLNAFSPCVKIYVYSSLSSLLVGNLQKEIQTELIYYQSEFVTDFRQADLILSTAPFLEPLKKNQYLLQISASISKNDRKSIHSRIQTIMQEKQSASLPKKL